MNIINNIVKIIREEIYNLVETNCNYGLDDVTYDSVKDIVYEVIDDYAVDLYTNSNYIRKSIMRKANIRYNNVDNYIINEVIYGENSIINNLEKRNKFFLKESLLSNDNRYNEKMSRLVYGAKLLGIPYVIDSDNILYIVNRDVKELVLTDVFARRLEVVDFRRLKNCVFLKKIVFNNNIKDILFLKEIKNININLKLYYNDRLCNNKVKFKLKNFNDTYNQIIIL